MRSIVVYFSQTGNTRKVAEAIQDAIRAATGQCDIVKLKEADVKALVDYDLIGLGCPAFHYEEPDNVKRFIRGMGLLRGKHCFIFATHGGHPGDVLPSMAGKLRRQGLKIMGGFNCDGSDRMPHFTSPWFTAGHPDEIDFKAATDFGKEMVGRSQRLSRGEKVIIPKLQSLGSETKKHIKETVTNKPRSRGFRDKMTLDKRKCRYPKCRLCVDNCPVDAIDLSVDPIVFRRGCISCLFCEMLCPTGAIEIDKGRVKSRRKTRIETIYNRKYPEFFERAKTELISNRSTLYRMLVDKVEIGSIHEMHGEAYRKRPRYVIRERN